MLRVELATQLMRVRTLIALAFLAAVPVMAGLSFASDAGHRNGTQGGLFGASPYSALNHTMASLEFIGPLLLPIVVALLATAIASADRDWGVLRYLYGCWPGNSPPSPSPPRSPSPAYWPPGSSPASPSSAGTRSTSSAPPT
jgi:hypothetical protein